MSEPKYTLEHLPNEPIIVAIFHTSFSMKNDVDTFIGEVRRLFDEAEPGFYYVNDARDLKISSLQDMFAAVNKATREMTSVLKHPGLKEYLLVTKDALISLAAHGLKSETFGKITVSVFDTLEEALAYARSEK